MLCFARDPNLALSSSKVLR